MASWRRGGERSPVGDWEDGEVGDGEVGRGCQLATVSWWEDGEEDGQWWSGDAPVSLYISIPAPE